MTLAPLLDQLTSSLSSQERQDLQNGEVVLMGETGSYAVIAMVKASVATVWEVLTDYEAFPEFLPSVVASRILETQDNRTVVERKDRRKIGPLPIKVKIVTENIEQYQDRVDYRMLEGTLDEMHGNWRLVALGNENGTEMSLLMQTITAKASMGPLQPYFYEVFEQGLSETMADLRTEMERRAAR